MIDYSDFIDRYFNKTLNKDEVDRFEKMLADDQKFAEQVAFYISTTQVLKEQLIIEKKERFKELLGQQNAIVGINRDRVPVRKLWIYRAIAAAALIILLISSWYLFYSRPLPVQQTADTYIQQHLISLPVNMSASMDSIQQGLKLYNDGNLNQALNTFVSIIKRDTANYSAKKYLGIVYLRLADYDQAFLFFQQLENYPLYSNPAIFYQALTLMKRNRSGDKPNAKQLLQRVVDNDLEGKAVALQWLKKM
jgi:tetratricopeptide (TPR) repeat protein